MNPLKKYSIVSCIGASLIIMGALFKIMHWKHSHWILLAGLGVTVIDGILFFTLRRKNSEEADGDAETEPAPKKTGPLIIFAIVCLVTGTVFTVIGFTFKIMHWPGSMTSLLAGVITLATGFGLFVAWSGRSGK